MNTHPALPDRLAALDDLASKAEVSFPDEPQSAIFWLREPDATAAKLLREIERIAALEEAKSTRTLEKWMRKQSRTYGAHSRQQQGWGNRRTFGWRLVFCRER